MGAYPAFDTTWRSWGCHILPHANTLAIQPRSGHSGLRLGTAVTLRLPGSISLNICDIASGRVPRANIHHARQHRPWMITVTPGSLLVFMQACRAMLPPRRRRRLGLETVEPDRRRTQMRWRRRCYALRRCAVPMSLLRRATLKAGSVHTSVRTCTYAAVARHGGPKGVSQS